MPMAPRAASEKLSNPETLIRFAQTIERYPQIYNPNHGGTKEDVENAWIEIARQFDDTAANCATKWHTLRSNFNRSLRVKTKTTKAYYLAKHLQYLLPYLKARSEHEYPRIDYESTMQTSADFEREFLNCYTTTDSVETIEHLPTATTPDAISVKVESTNDDFDQSELQSLSSYSADASKVAAAQKRKCSVEIVNEVPPAQEKRQCRQQNNSDLEFFHSILPLMEKLNDSENLAFRISVLQSLQKIIDNKR